MHTTSPQLRDLRQTRVVVLMPDDADRLALMQQLQRIGVDAHVAWPPLPSLPEGTDVVFLTVQPETLMLRPPWIEGREAPALIAVVGYESPTIVSAVLAPAVSTGR